MGDEELIAWLRELAAVLGKDAFTCAADRIEALVNEAVLNKAAYESVSSLLLSVQQDCIKECQRAERLETLVEHAFAEGFAEGSDVGWVEGDYTPAWHKSVTRAARAALTTEKPHD